MPKPNKSLSTRTLKKITSIAEKSIAEANKWGWPPECIGIFHQPERPKSLHKDNNE